MPSFEAMPNDRKHRYCTQVEGSPRNKILCIYHKNFLKNNTGANSYVMQVVKQFKEFGYSIDFLGTDRYCDNFPSFDEDNKKYNGLVANHFIYEDRQKPSYKKHFYSPISLIHDAFLDYFQQTVSKTPYRAICVFDINLLELIKFTEIDPHTKIIWMAVEFNSMHSFNWSEEKFTKKIAAFGSHIADEIELMHWCDDIFCISDNEKRLFEKFHNDVNFHFLPYFMDPKNCDGVKKDIDCLFVGDSNLYNKASMVWFIDQVLPLLAPGITFTICGTVCDILKKDNPEQYEKAIQYGMQMLGFVDDLDEIHARTKISLAPILAGAGLKIKTINAMAFGIPVVATDLGVDGFPDKTENGCVIANTPQEFVYSIMRLLQDQKFYNSMVVKCKKYFKRHFCREKNGDVLRKIF